MPKVSNLNTKEQLAAIAHPVQTGYVPRDIPKVTELETLARSLESVQPSLTRFLEKRKTEQEENDVSKGESLYILNNNRLSWADYVKEHPEYTKANPWVREGYLRARMANEGENYRTWIQAQASGENAFIEENGQRLSLAEATSDQVSKWQAQQLQRYVQEKMGGAVDPAMFSDIFMPQASAANRELMSRIISYQQDVTWNKNITEHMTLATNVVKGALDVGAFDGVDSEGTYQNVGEQLSNMAQEMMVDGVPPDVVQSNIVKSIVALADNDEVNVDDVGDIFDILNYVKVNGYTLGDLPEVKALVEDKKDAVEQEAYWKKRRHEEEEEKQKKEAIEQDNRNIAITFFGNHGNIPKEVKKNYINKHGFEDYVHLLRLLSTSESYDKNSGGGSSTDIASLYYKHMQNEDVTAEQILNSDGTSAQKIAFMKAIQGETEEVKKLRKQITPVITKGVFQALFNVDSPDNELLAYEDMQYAKEFGMFVACNVFDNVQKQVEGKNQDIYDNPLALNRITFNAVAEEVNKSKPLLEGFRQERINNPSLSMDTYTQNPQASFFDGLKPSDRTYLESLLPSFYEAAEQGNCKKNELYQYIEGRATQLNVDPQLIVEQLLKKQ